MVPNGKPRKCVSELEGVVGEYHSLCHHGFPEVQVNISQDLGNCGQERYSQNVIPMG